MSHPAGLLTSLNSAGRYSYVAPRQSAPPVRYALMATDGEVTTFSDRLLAIDVCDGLNEPAWLVNVPTGSIVFRNRLAAEALVTK